MYQYYPGHQLQQQFSPWYNQPYIPQSIISFETFNNSPHLLPSSSLATPHYSAPKQDPKTISYFELVNLLEDRTNELQRLHEKDQQQQLPILIDLITTLSRVQTSVLVSAAQNNFFALLRTPFTDTIHQWRRFAFLSDNESFIFCTTTKLIHRLIKAVDEVEVIPLWLSDSTLIETISNCLTDISTSGKLLDDRNKHQFKYFAHLIDAYTLYQQHLNHLNLANQDILVQLLDPILHCLTSSHFITTFTNLQVHSTSMSTKQKFFLLKCPAFLTSYNGFRLEQTMDSLLSAMLPRYVTLLDEFVPSAHNWKRSMMQSIQCLLRTINHGANKFPIIAKHISYHLSIVDHVLKLIDEPIFYNNLRETLSNPETMLMNTAISFLVNMISEPTILAHIKQSHVASIFLRLTSCRYEPLVLNVYTLLGYTTHEDNIKTMHNTDRLLITIIESLKTTLNQSPEKSTQIEQLLETLKGLVQHDQIKDEIIKQNMLPFLLECTNKLYDKAHVLIFEILWSLTFREEGALALRSNDAFLRKIQTISKDSTDEPLKKAADGLVWKLIREPAFLQKVAKQEEEEKNTTIEVTETVIEEVVNSDGQKEFITTIKPATNATGERIFQYDMMISYCHADKELAYKIHKFLVNQGFKIWIDLDNMYGPAMSAMADAVENSEFVIMCMSDSYKESTYCQAEAEYAFKCKRRLIPLIMRQGYKPDGWLGFMIGSRIYIDFGRYDFEIACEKLITEIGLQSKRPLPSKLGTITHHEKPGGVASHKQQQQQQLCVSRREKPLVSHNNNVFSTYTKRKPLSKFVQTSLNQWTESDVLDFLFTERLIPMMPLCETMNGGAVLQLYKMCMSRSSRTYILLNDELKSTFKMKLPIGIYTRFLGAMEQRLSTRPLAPTGTMLKFPERTVTTVLQEYIPHTSRTSAVNYDTSQYPVYPDGPYDAVITSNAPALEVLRAVERYGLNFTKMISS